MYLLWRKKENSVFEGWGNGVVMLPCGGAGRNGMEREESEEWERFIRQGLQVTATGALDSSLSRTSTSLETWPQGGSEDWIRFTFSQCISRQVTPSPSDGSSYFLREEEELRKCPLGGALFANGESARGSWSIVSRSPQGMMTMSRHVLVTFELENKRVSLRIRDTFLILLRLPNRVPNCVALP